MFSNYAESNCPKEGAKLPTLCKGDCSDPANSDAQEGPYWSLMFEISESNYKPVNLGATKLGGAAGSWCVLIHNVVMAKWQDARKSCWSSPFCSARVARTTILVC